MPHRFAGSAVALGLLLPLPASADSAGEDGHVAALDEVLVTARRRTEALADVPINLQVVSGEALARIGAEDSVDYARFVPGLSFSDDGARGGAIMVLRGLRTGGEGGLGISLGVTTSSYVDDIPVDLPARGAPLDLKILDVDRIEVLRGPQGTLYGAGAIGGTLRYIARKPVPGELSGHAQAEVNSIHGGGDGGSVAGGINLPVGETAALRLNAGWFDDAGYIQDTGLGARDVNDARTTSARAAFRWQPSEALTLDLSYYYQRGEYGSNITVNESLGRHVTENWAPEDGAVTAQLLNATIVYDMGFAELTSSTSYVDEKLRYLDDATVTIRDLLYADIVDFGVAVGDLPPDTVLPPFVTRSTSKLSSHSFSQELRLASPSGGRLEWVGGAYYTRYPLQDFLQERVPNGYEGQADFEAAMLGAGYIGGPFNDELEYVINGEASFRQWAAFGEMTVNLTPAWSVSVGGRHFDYESERTEYQIDQWFFRTPEGFAITDPAPEDYTTGRSSDDGEIWRLGTAWDFDAGLVYATIGTGYRPGGYNASAPGSDPPPQYKPDEVLSFEIGFKTELLDNRLYASVAAYTIDWTDIQTSVLDDNFNVYMGNAGKALSRGVELELTGRDLLAPGLTTMVTFGYNESELTQSVPLFGYDGDRVPMVPRESASLLLDYERHVGGRWIAGVNANATYTGSSYNAFGAFVPDEFLDPVPQDQYLKLGAYWLAHLSLRFGTDRMTTRFFVDNLFDEDPTLSRGFIDTSLSPYTAPYVSRSVGRPRTIGVSMSYEF